jgi:hypothetical protein
MAPLVPVIGECHAEAEAGGDADGLAVAIDSILRQLFDFDFAEPLAEEADGISGRPRAKGKAVV